MKKKVFITREIPEKAINVLKEEFDVLINHEDRILTRKELLENVYGVDAVLCTLSDQIDKEIQQKAVRCKIFANYAVGYNNIDLKAASKLKKIVTNTPDVLNDATADLAWTLLFSTARRVVEADKFTRDGKFKQWSPLLFLGKDISGATLGVVGAGRIGKTFAERAKAFKMKILYTDLKPNRDFETLTNGCFVSREELFKEADFISLHVPLLPETRHYVGRKEFALMKKSAVLINTSRGPVVDEKALVKALLDGEIWGAGLDVYENEPLLEEELKDLKNVTLLPHIGSATEETRINMGLIAAQNIINVLKGQTPVSCVNKEVLESL